MNRAKVKSKWNDLIFVWQFALDDFKGRFAGSLLGSSWAFIQPIVTILIYYFIFQFGFRSTPVEDVPYVLWLVAGLLPWFYISETIIMTASCLAEYSYLVKKVVFNVQILPLSKVCSGLFIQGVLFIFIIGLFAVFGQFPTIYYLQLPLYLIYMVIFLVGLGYISSSLYAFFKDTAQVISIVTQVFFWMTPIVWDISIMPEATAKILAFNPVYYVVMGYRSAFIYKEFYFPGIGLTCWYWGIALVTLIGGRLFFDRCKKHFADVM